MADNRRPSSVPSEDYYKTRTNNSNNISRKSSMQAGAESPKIVCADRSLFIFSKDNIIRKICRTIIESKVSFQPARSALVENVFSALALSEFVVVDSWSWACVLVPCQCIVFVKSKLKFSGQFVVCLWLDSVSSFSIFFFWLIGKFVFVLYIP